MNKPMTTEELAIMNSEWNKNPSKPRAHFAKLKKQLYSVVQTREGKSVLRGELKENSTVTVDEENGEFTFRTY